MMTLSELGRWLKKERAQVNGISYGSGGYCVTLMDMNNCGIVVGYNWDIEIAFKEGIDKLNKQREQEKRENYRDRDTEPEIKIA